MGEMAWEVEGMKRLTSRKVLRTGLSSRWEDRKTDISLLEREEQELEPVWRLTREVFLLLGRSSGGVMTRPTRMQRRQRLAMLLRVHLQPRFSNMKSSARARRKVPRPSKETFF